MKHRQTQSGLPARPNLARRLAGKIKEIGADQGGVAAIEFGLFAIFLSIALLNVTDTSIYIYQRMQAENATQAAVEAAWKACFRGLGLAIGGYYCVNSSNALQKVSDVSSRPADCTAAGTPALQPGDYIKVQTTFPYAPLFPGLSVTSKFTTPISTTAIMRLG